MCVIIIGRKRETPDTKTQKFVVSRICIGRSENRNYGQNSNFLSKIEFFVKNRIFSQNPNSGQNSKFSLKIEIFVKDRNIRQNSELFFKIEISF